MADLPSCASCIEPKLHAFLFSHPLSRSRTIHLVWRVPRAMSETRVPRNVCLDRIFLRGCEIATADIIQSLLESRSIAGCSRADRRQRFIRELLTRRRNEREKSKKQRNVVSSFVRVGARNEMNFVCSNLLENRWNFVRWRIINFNKMWQNIRQSDSLGQISLTTSQTG